MNREEAKRILANLEWIKGFANGKDVQIIEHYNEGIEWESCEELNFLNPPESYRFKPEPREFTVCLCKRYKPFKIQEMRCNNCEGYGNCEIIKVREVIE